MRYSLAEVRRKTYKERDAWWTVLLVDPLAARIVLVVANLTRLTPNHLTFMALGVGCAAAAAFAYGTYSWLVAGALLYHLSFVLDCVDGKIARLKGTGSFFGMWLDYVFDRLRVLACTLALMGGQYRVTGDDVYLFLAFGVIFLDMLRYVDALQVARIRDQMDMTVATARGELKHQGLGETSDSGVIDDPGGAARGLGARSVLYARWRDALMRRRIRPHVFSGIEFQMFVFIVAPLTGRIVEVVIGASALVLVFESFVVYSLWASTRDLGKVLKVLRETAPSPAPAVDPPNTLEEM